ncbi:DUF7405 family protein [Haloprofundus salilacus]|uniref:DUF7405 family protein n=1 Tax=Haloprofundus salilacus TaxID=2876190 RepID=UPI001CCED519|nr:hypothetical protein [Haloprofundus salilacus]
MVSRRTALSHLAVVTGTVGLSGCSRLLDPATGPGVDGLSANPRSDRLPDRQFAQNEYLPTDDVGNHLQARYRRILLLDLQREPSVEDARTVEQAMRTLEAAYNWHHEGLFHTLAWGTNYFERIGELSRVPIDPPQVLSRTDDPDLQSFDAALVLESDLPSHLAAAESALFGSRKRLGGESVDHRLGDVFRVRGRRTGFLGEGLPAEHADAEGVPGDALTGDEQMFMGFFSGRNRTQPREESVAIPNGRFVDGTTMHLSRLTVNLRDWYGTLDENERIARMFSPEFTEDDVAKFTDDVPFSNQVREHARDHDVVGHHEKVAQVRRDDTDEPLVLRRDFNTVDGGKPGVHFVTFQRKLDHFRRTRKAMNGWYVRDDSPDITDREHNGILNFIRVTSRANFYVPARNDRSFPLL